MKVSVVSIAKTKKELEPLKNSLKKQTFKDWEFVYSTKKGIPQAWNDAISRTKGEIIITTDSDVEILTNTWLEEMTNAVEKHNKNDPEKKTIVRGIEISPNLPWTWCNVAFYLNTFKKNKVDENYPIAEDTEFFARLKNLGYKSLELPIAPVLHERDKDFIKILKRSYKYGVLNTKINLKYGSVGFKNEKKEGFNIFKRETMIIISHMLYSFGVLSGFINYRFRRLIKFKSDEMDWRKEQKEVYDEIVRRSPTKHQVIYVKDALERLDNIIPKNGKILDIGCGSGHYAEVLNDREWYGVDISPESIKTAKKFYKEAKVGDITTHIPFPDKSFDYVLALSVFHHIHKCIPEALKEVKRVLKPNGEIIVIDHDARNAHTRNVTSGRFLHLTPTKSEKCLYPETVLKILKESGFEVKEFDTIRIHADQQALKPHIIIRMIKVPLMWVLDIFSPKYPGEFLIKAKLRK